MRWSEVEKNGFEWLRILTPVLLAVSLFILTQVYAQITDVGVKLYHHITNDELHVPRSEYVNLYNQIANMQNQIIQTIREDKRS